MTDTPDTLPMFGTYTRRDQAPLHLRTLDSAALTVEQINEINQLAWQYREDRVIPDHLHEESGEILPGGVIPVLNYARARDEFRVTYEVRGTLWVRRAGTVN